MTVAPTPPSTLPIAPVPLPVASSRQVVTEARIDLDETPNGIAFGADAVWVVGRSVMYRIDPITNVVSKAFEISLLYEGGNFAVGFDSLWLPIFRTGQVVRQPLNGGAPVDLGVGGAPDQLIVAHGSVWVSQHHSGRVDRIDPLTSDVTSTTDVGPAGIGGPSGLDASDEGIWVGIPNSGELVFVDAATNAAAIHVPLGDLGIGEEGPCGALVIEPVVWAAGCDAPEPWIAAVDADSGARLKVFSVDGLASPLAAINGLLWIPLSGSGGVTMAAVDESFESVDAVRLDEVGAIAVGSDSVWVTAPNANQVWRISLAEFESPP
ncbi:MAG TPA: hypothetical protein VM284_02315 [Candidatus Limnocylindria bacterium]|nr:hypothetical protein [Candidatus Limnocylindria bacterium]